MTTQCFQQVVEEDPANKLYLTSLDLSSKAFNGKKWDKFNSEKVASLPYARIQGKAAFLGYFQNSSLMNEDKRCRLILFSSQGPEAGDQSHTFTWKAEVEVGRLNLWGSASRRAATWLLLLLRVRGKSFLLQVYG